MGLGRSDIVIKDRRNRRAVVIEVEIDDGEEKMEAERIDVGDDLDVYFASVTGDRIYYRASKDGKDQTMFTKLDRNNFIMFFKGI